MPQSTCLKAYSYNNIDSITLCYSNIHTVTLNLRYYKVYNIC